MHRQDRSRANDACDWGDVADEIEVKLRVQRRTDRAARTNHEQRIAVRRRLHHRLGADAAARARTVVDQELLTETLRQPLADEACDNVGPATGSRGDDDPHWSRRIRLRRCNAPKGREDGGARYKTQKFTPDEFHSCSPELPNAS